LEKIVRKPQGGIFSDSHCIKEVETIETNKLQIL